MSDFITLQEASVVWVKNLENRVAFFNQQLLEFLYTVRRTKEFDGQKIGRLRKDANLQRLFFETVMFLEERNLIEETGYKYYVVKNHEISDLEIICSLYPYGYLSYLTAMQIYNLTNRFPKSIDFTAPPRAEWKKQQKQHFTENKYDDPHFSPDDFITPYPSEIIRFKRKKMNVHTRKNLSPFVHRGENLRVIEIGCLFLEMLRFPNACGGFQHVFEIYEEMGEIFKERILSATDSFGTSIDKSRVGYIFEKHLDIQDDRISKWKTSSVSRGGSRKMLADEPYSDTYDEDWCISLNHVIFE